MQTKKRSKPSLSQLTAQQLIGVEEINDDILYTRDKVIYAYISVRAMGDGLRSESERQTACERLTREIEKERGSFQLLSVPRVVDTQAIISYLLQLKKQTGNHARLALIDGEIDAVQDMARRGAKEPMILIKMWGKEGPAGERELEERVGNMLHNLRSLQGMEASRLKNSEIAFVCKQIADLGAPLEEGGQSGEMPVLSGRRGAAADLDLLNEITPMGGITVEPKGITIGGAAAKVYAVSGYPRELPYGWATEIMNNTEAVTSITVDPVGSGELGAALSRTIRSASGEAMGERDARKSKQLVRQVKDADAMLEELDEHNEQICRLSILTMPFAPCKEELVEACKRTQAMFGSHRIKLRELGQMQKEGFISLSPYGTTHQLIDQAYSRLMPVFTLAGGSAMAINSYQDAGGFYFAKTSTGNLVCIDLWYRGGDRTNSNFLMLGKAGAGKSTLIKHIIQMEFMRGTKILIVDPESEYTEITRLLGGDVLYAGGGKDKINLLQVRPSPYDDEDENDDSRLYGAKQSGNDLAMHLKNMDTLFRAYLVDAPELFYAALERACIELYEQFGMGWDCDFSSMPADAFPTMADLHMLLEKKGRSDPACLELAARLYSAGAGSDRFIFNGHTNIDLSAQILCFDINALQSAPDKIKRTQYLNLLGLCWEIMSRDRDEKVLLICDEAYLLIDQNLPQSLMYLRNIEKRCRKFSGALGIATHSVVDLLHDNIRQYGQAILDIPTYKFFLAADGQNLKELSELYSLTERQQSILRAGARGEALGMLGSSMMHLRFELPQYKLDNMGRAGGR